MPLAVIGDPGRLRQILVNLVGNAIKFTEHGEVEVQAARTMVVGDVRLLHFAVRDTGIGIPAEKMDTIFERPFRRKTVPLHDATVAPAGPVHLRPHGGGDGRADLGRKRARER